MKIQNYLITTVAISTVSLSLLLAGCGDADHHDSEMEGHHEHAEADHGHAGGGHMQHMDAVRASLKAELKEQYDVSVPAMSEVVIAKGKEVYARTCVTCHGVSGKGDGPASVVFAQKPADFTDPAHSSYYSDQGRIHIIKNGVPGTPMTGWKSILKEDEVQAVYGYVRSLRATAPSAEDAHTDGAYVCPMHPQITSDAPGKCSICGMNLVKEEASQGHEDHSEHAH
ncbi:MAG: heavy metal-binding domain-containing protein [Opitutaceae bacterium]